MDPMRMSNAATAKSAEESHELLQLLQKDSDMDLVFRNSRLQEEVVPGHTLILKTWSTVMRDAIDTARSSSSSSDQRIRIPITGTSKDEWLLVMKFIYPIVPRPQVTWDNLELLLKISDKFCMPALLQDQGAFIVQNSKQLDSYNYGRNNNHRFVWKWIYIADKYRMTEVAKKCIAAHCQTDLRRLMQNCPKYHECYPASYDGHKLSDVVVQYLWKTMYGAYMIIA